MEAFRTQLNDFISRIEERGKTLGSQTQRTEQDEYANFSDYFFNPL